MHQGVFGNLKEIDVPVLILHGDDDQVVPYENAALHSIEFVKNGTLKIYKGFPHGMCTTHADVRSTPTSWRSFKGKR